MIPQFEKKYKVFWKYYYRTTTSTVKLFEYLTRQEAIDLARRLFRSSLTFYVSVSDYEGNWKHFEKPVTYELLCARDKVFDDIAEQFGGGDEGMSKCRNFLRNYGDYAVLTEPLAVRAYIAKLRKRRKSRLSKFEQEVMEND